MQPTRALVLSDAHLGAVPERSERRLAAFLEAAPERADELVVAGDLFDFWFEYRTVVLREHFGILRRLADAADRGLRIRLVGGNHDAWGGSFLREEVGVEPVDGPVTTRVGGRRTYLAHGDGLGGGDWGYRALKRVIRSRPAVEAFRLLPPDLAVPLVRGLSGTDGESAGAGSRAGPLADHAAELIRGRPDLELVVFGHSHRPRLDEVEPGRFYLNPGDWIDEFTYGVVGPETVELRRWDRG